VKQVQQIMSKILLFLLLCLIPTQLGKHFWFDWTMVLGIRIDYLSPTLYLVDLVWIVLLISNLIKPSVLWTSPLKKETFFKSKFFLVIVFVVINIFVAQNRWVAIYKWARIGQLVWFGYFGAKNKNLMEKMLMWVLPLWIGVESLLAIGQIAKGGSLNGFWWWLGERSFDFNTIGIAQMSVVNNGIVRAYGTFSHPNSLAGFLLISMVLWVKFKESLSSYKVFKVIKLNVLWWGVTWLGIIGIILTGSRTVWFLGLISIFWLSWGNFRNIKNKGIILFLVVMMLFGIYKMIDYNYPIQNFLGGWDENGLLKRGLLNLAAVEMIKKSPLLGVGLNNFLIKLPDYQQNNQIFWFQPVHNIGLLLISEIGILGILIFAFSAKGGLRFASQFSIFKTLKKLIRNNDKIIILILGVIFLSGMVDHYWFTLPQNMWLLTLVLALI